MGFLSDARSALHYILVRGSLRVPFIIVSTAYCSRYTASDRMFRRYSDTICTSDSLPQTGPSDIINCQRLIHYNMNNIQKLW